MCFRAFCDEQAKLLCLWRHMYKLLAVSCFAVIGPTVSSFRYLGHIIANTLSDKDDNQREIKSMFFSYQHFNS